MGGRVSVCAGLRHTEERAEVVVRAYSDDLSVAVWLPRKPAVPGAAAWFFTCVSSASMTTWRESSTWLVSSLTLLRLPDAPFAQQKPHACGRLVVLQPLLHEHADTIPRTA